VVEVQPLYQTQREYNADAWKEASCKVTKMQYPCVNKGCAKLQHTFSLSIYQISIHRALVAVVDEVKVLINTIRNNNALSGQPGHPISLRDIESLKNIRPAAQILSTIDVHGLAVHDSKTKAFTDKLKMFFRLVVLKLADNIRNIATKQKADIIALLGMRRCKTDVAIVSKEKTP
jgi:hypothetical protein